MAKQPLAVKYEALLVGDKFALVPSSDRPYYRYAGQRKSESLVGNFSANYFHDNTIVYVFPDDDDDVAKNIPFTPAARGTSAVSVEPKVVAALPPAPKTPPEPEKPKFVACRPD